ncbi:PREDICTED: periplasmic beta-glucosidase-like [Thamnophis sirtalis]|uniref:Periplasmic beta-glucosidase-like n=1 Tax=Thamnophis sirtalis TaxID=35019 RepID=A0A6I9Y336_9SAUR|nr:PREDICTED: periplasmic beta-glucosidase-like [Thamnophis sirtalis]
MESESNDRKDLSLPGHQLDLLQSSVAWATGRPVILLLFNAGPLDISWAKEQDGVGAIVACFFPAETTGLAVAKMLVGAEGANPAGRLPATWPAGMDQVPPIENYTMIGRTYRYYGHEAPMYPFGYGLSYTAFQYRDLVVSADQVPICGNLSISAVVENVGSRDGEEVVQLYLHWGQASVPMPRWQLVGFRRLPIRQGQAAKVAFLLSFSQRAVWDGQWWLEPGTFTVFVGGQQPFQEVRLPSNVLQTDFHVFGDSRSASQC